ncbi:MAG TPA: tripartite tricarboxylate transporter substrate binding protein [Burkholderiales bacterium]|jgi:tripartite-type tricarboxylate transporter receptor subunit TctC
MTVSIRSLGRLAAALFGVAALASASLSCAQDKWPSRPVRIIVPASAGGASDVVARMLSTRLAEVLGQPFVVDNHAGAGGVIGAQLVAQAAPDGYTMLMSFDSFTINSFLFKNVPDPLRDFAPVTQVCLLPQVFLVHPGLKVKTLKDFVLLAKAKRTQLNYGSAGPASSSRLAFELFEDVAGIDVVAVHYKGGGPAIQALLSGQVQAMLVQGGGTIQQNVKAGKLVALAVSTAAPSPLHPGLPTIAASYPGFETQSWVGLVAPAKTPRPLIDRLNATIAKIVAEPAMKEQFTQQGAEIVAGSPEAMTKLMRDEQGKWSRLIQKRKISVD